MTTKHSSISPKKKKSKRDVKDSRVDALLPNTLYLINLKFNLKKRRASELNNEYLSSDTNEVTNFNSNVDKNTVSLKKNGFHSISPHEDETKSSDSPSLKPNASYTDNLCDIGVIDTGNSSCCKSHACFLGMDCHCLKYDLSSCSENHFSKDSPNYSSFVISNIFLKRSPDLQFDEAALYDASWEVESVHICKQIKNFLRSQSHPEDDNYDSRSVSTTTTYSSVTSTFTPTTTTTMSSTSQSPNIRPADAPITDLSKITNGVNNKFAEDTFDAKIDTNTNHSKEIRLLEGFCGIGGNFVHFVSTFDYCLGIELDENRVKICKNNIEVYGASNDYSIVNDDFFNFAEEFLKDPKYYFETKLNRPHLYRDDGPQFDWVFLSPPWGGTNYKGSNTEEIYIFEDCFPKFYRCMELCAKLGKNVTLFVPRSQSVVEIAKAASCANFKFILIDSYLMLPTFNKIRCSMIHLLSDANMFTNNFDLKNAKRMNPKTFFTSSFLSSKSNNGMDVTAEPPNDVMLELAENNHNFSPGSESANIICVNNYVYELKLYNLMALGFLMLLNEYNPNVYKKFNLLLQQVPLADVMKLINTAIETYCFNGLKTLSGEKRTLGGTFFYLLKMGHNSVYKNIEKTLKKN